MENNNAQGHESGHQKYEKGFEDGYNAAIKYDNSVAALQARCDRYEKALKEIRYVHRMESTAAWKLNHAQNVAIQALEWKGEKEPAKLTPEQIEERKDAIEWYRNPTGEKGIAVFVPCAEDDTRACGSFTSADGRSLCHVRESTVPVIEQGAVWLKALKDLPLHKAFWNMPGEHLNNECYFPVRIDGFKYRVGEIFDNRQEGAPAPIYYFVIDGVDYFEKDFHRIEWLDESAGEKEGE